MPTAPPPDESKAERWLRLLALGLSALFVLVFLYVALRRLQYPFAIDRVESGMMTSVWRLRHGYPLYAAPSLAWAPYLYAPLFFYLSAAMSKLMGVGYGALRMVSILSTLGSFCVIFLMVWRETRRVAAAIVAVGIFASLYAFVFGWFDVGRVDSLSVFLFLAAVYATRRMHPIAAAVVWLLAFHAKQTFLPLGFAVFLVEWRRPRRMLTGMAAFAVMAWASVLWLNHLTHHWYSYYAFGTVGVLGWSPRDAAMFLPVDLFSPLPIAVVLIVAAVLLAPLRWRERDGSFFVIVTVLLGGATWFVRAHGGANVNAIIPFYAWMAILTGVAIDRLLTKWESGAAAFAAASAWPPQLQRWRVSGAALLWIALSVQLMAHLYRPGQILPRASELAARQQFVETVRATPGDVWLVNHSYDGLLAGKPMHAEMDALDAVLGRGYKPAVEEFNRRIAAHDFAAVVLDYPPRAYEPTGLFTSPPFSSAYGLIAILPEAAISPEYDQPKILMLPCSAATQNGSGLLDVNAELLDRSGCP